METKDSESIHSLAEKRELESFDQQIRMATSIRDFSNVKSRINGFLTAHPDDTEALNLLAKLETKRTDLRVPNMVVKDDRPVGRGPTGGTRSNKSFVAVLLLLLLLGAFGAHRFYAGKPGTAILFIFTLGGLGFWGLYDLIMIVTGKFKDSDGRNIEA